MPVPRVGIEPIKSLYIPDRTNTETTDEKGGYDQLGFGRVLRFRSAEVMSYPLSQLRSVKQALRPPLCSVVEPTLVYVCPDVKPRAATSRIDGRRLKTEQAPTVPGPMHTARVPGPYLPRPDLPAPTSPPLGPPYLARNVVGELRGEATPGEKEEEKAVEELESAEEEFLQLLSQGIIEREDKPQKLWPKGVVEQLDPPKQVGLLWQYPAFSAWPVANGARSQTGAGTTAEAGLSELEEGLFEEVAGQENRARLEVVLSGLLEERLAAHAVETHLNLRLVLRPPRYRDIRPDDSSAPPPKINQTGLTCRIKEVAVITAPRTAYSSSSSPTLIQLTASTRLDFTRGGICNFVHVKMDSRVMRRLGTSFLTSQTEFDFAAEPQSLTAAGDALWFDPKNVWRPVALSAYGRGHRWPSLSQTMISAAAMGGHIQPERLRAPGADYWIHRTEYGPY
ncbi:hypothetical protein FIBSPDRAFT_902387 [Athelia psychrophila]|uniref:Uncharacterized protein n=1 Tax=Athelia psychrophila TaxID=1759441 RepID=A0A167XAD2_9AGAM|nr:hypothetical protein FIBSPDRAFT_902387 [Fibularhizoctonia sp. CBS 109695]